MTAQLINADDGSHEWSKRFDRKLDDVFAIQDELTSAIRDAVGGTLLGARAEAKYQTDPETYDFVLRGRALLLTSSVRVDEAMGIIQRAAERDPAYVPALVALADAHAFSAMWARQSGRKSWSEVRRITDQLVSRAPHSSAAARLTAEVMTWAQRDLVGAEEQYRRALALNPNDMLAHGFLGLTLAALGRPREGDAHNRRMITLDPVSAFSYVFAANNWATSGDFAAAEIAASEAIAIDPRYPEGYHMRGYNRNYLGRFQESYDDLIRVAELGNRTAWPLAKRSGALAGMGRFDEVRALLNEMLERSKTEFMTPDAIACMYQFLGQNDEAFRWLELAVEDLTIWIPFIGIDALFAPLRKDPRFTNFCNRHRIPVQPLAPSAFDHLVVPAA